MKTNHYVQFLGNDVEMNELTKFAKEEWKALGYKVKDIKTLDVYYKPEEKTCYYVFNDDVTGSFGIE